MQETTEQPTPTPATDDLVAAAKRAEDWAGEPFLHNGEEPTKGPPVIQEAHRLLAETDLNFTGNVEVSQIDPTRFGLGDLFETTNRETAAGISSHVRTAPMAWGPIEAVFEPGIHVRAGHTDQAKSLLVPDVLSVWDRRFDAGIATLDAGAYVDVDMRFWRRLRVSTAFPRAGERPYLDTS